MAIDGRVAGVRKVDGLVKLTLEPRECGTTPGQSTLIVTNPPDNWEQAFSPLIGMCLWGNSSQVILGEKLFAYREGYIDIVLSDTWEQAITEYANHRSTRN